MTPIFSYFLRYEQKITTNASIINYVENSSSTLFEGKDLVKKDNFGEQKVIHPLNSFFLNIIY